MPYLQLDVSNSYDADTKRVLAKRLGDAYAEVMKTTSDRVTVCIRELGEGSIWRCAANSDPTPGAILMCDIRKGRDTQTRERLAKLLVEICNDSLKLGKNHLNVEFTQHEGDEMYHQWMGKLSENWNPNEQK